MSRLFLLVVLVFVGQPSLAQTPVTFSPNPGNLVMLEHVPAGTRSPLPLVLVLHGCSQDRGYADDVGLLGLADARGFAVVIAETSSGNNSSRCFNWFESGDITPGSGEQRSLLAMVESMKARHDIDDARVFVTGVSSGGAMTAMLLATAPDVFAAGATFAGVPFRCGLGVTNAFSCMNGGVDKTQAQWAALVEDNVVHDGAWPRLMVVHGSSDSTVRPKNADDLALQFTGLHGLTTTPTSTSTAGGITTKRWLVDDREIVTTVLIDGMGHGTPVDPPVCGSVGAFVLDEDLCGSALAVDFFGLFASGEGEGEGEGEEMASGQQGGEGQGQEAQRGEGRDPLGREGERNTGSGDNVESDQGLGRAHLERLRSHQLQQELRRRGAERERTPVELDYIDRLLRRF